VHAPAVIEQVDVFKNGPCGLWSACATGFGTTSSIFKVAKSSLLARCSSSLRALMLSDNSVVGQQLLVGVAGVLTAAIRVMQESARRLPLLERQAECIHRELAVDTLIHRFEVSTKNGSNPMIPRPPNGRTLTACQLERSGPTRVSLVKDL
jgi:hypothetical protein